jgi:hypothetical protein
MVSVQSGTGGADRTTNLFRGGATEVVAGHDGAFQGQYVKYVLFDIAGQAPKFVQ